jgi:hypothetical protein
MNLTVDITVVVAVVTIWILLLYAGSIGYWVGQGRRESLVRQSLPESAKKWHR